MSESVTGGTAVEHAGVFIGLLGSSESSRKEARSAFVPAARWSRVIGLLAVHLREGLDREELLETRVAGE